MNKPELIVMLTHDDLTVDDAYRVFDECRHSQARYWGFKESPLPLEEMKRTFSLMKSCGKQTVLEVVSYSEHEGLEGARMAVECGCDILMGTCFHRSILQYCLDHNLRYMPFVGEVSQRPSILEGSAQGMIAQARDYVAQGAYGIDLLGYRYDGDAAQLIEHVVGAIEVPVCVAGSIDSYERIQEMKRISPWAFTIGSAFFDHRFGRSIPEEVDAVCNYIKE